MKIDKKNCRSSEQLIQRDSAGLMANAQYSRTECLEIVGIPCSVDKNSFEEKVIHVFKKVNSVFQTEPGQFFTLTLFTFQQL